MGSHVDLHFFFTKAPTIRNLFFKSIMPIDQQPWPGTIGLGYHHQDHWISDFRTQKGRLDYRSGEGSRSHGILLRIVVFSGDFRNLIKFVTIVRVYDFANCDFVYICIYYIYVVYMHNQYRSTYDRIIYTIV